MSILFAFSQHTQPILGNTLDKENKLTLIKINVHLNRNVQTHAVFKQTSHPSRATKTLENLPAIITIHTIHFIAPLAANILGVHFAVCFVLSCQNHHLSLSVYSTLCSVCGDLDLTLLTPVNSHQKNIQQTNESYKSPPARGNVASQWALCAFVSVFACFLFY